MGYPKPNKLHRNEQYLQSQSFPITDSPYLEEVFAQKQLLLIICEGENTERFYFESFPVPSKTVIVDGGRGSKTALVKYALAQKEKLKYEGYKIWCVFDYDVKPDECATQPQDFNNSIAMAQANGMFVAWSNDAFELWFYLHYDAVDVGIERKDINTKLKEKWGLKSFKNEAKKPSFCMENYKRHGGTKSETQKAAIKRARNLHKAYKSRTDFANHCPCTTVYLLVEELNKNLKE